MITEQEIDQIIASIEDEWRANGYFGDVRDDHSLVYEVATRLHTLLACKVSTYEVALRAIAMLPSERQNEGCCIALSALDTYC